jgi:hypothetical protein
LPTAYNSALLGNLSFTSISYIAEPNADLVPDWVSRTLTSLIVRLIFKPESSRYFCDFL